MYGLLAGCQRALCGASRTTWRRHLCGLCESLSRAFGPPARLLATPDAALLTVLVEAQARRPLPYSSPSRCFGRRPFFLRVPDTRSVASRFARSVALTAAAARVEDAVHDGDVRPRWLAHLATRLLAPMARRAGDELAGLGFDAATVARAQADAAQRETHSRSFDALAEPVEAVYAAVFGQTAALAECPGNAPAARDFGRWFGRLTYATDAHTDYADDLIHERFNPLATCFGRRARTAGADIISAALGGLRTAVARLEVARHGELLGQLVGGGLTRRISWACDGSSEGGKIVRRREPAERTSRPTTPPARGGRAWGGCLDRGEVDDCCPWCAVVACCDPACCFAPCLCCS